MLAAEALSAGAAAFRGELDLPVAAIALLLFTCVAAAA